MSFAENRPVLGLAQEPSTNINYGSCNRSNVDPQVPSMASRNGYDAATPEYAEFSVQHTPIPSTSTIKVTEGPGGSTNDRSFRKTSEGTKGYVGLSSDELDEEGEVFDGSRGDERTSRWCSAVVKIGALVKDNAGLLLVMGSQMFLSMVNVAVKQLNSIDPPVPVLEVCTRIDLVIALAR